MKVSQVAEDLGVRFVLEGSGRQESNRVRVAAQLIDAIAGHLPWAKRYERHATGIFALQDSIAWDVATALEVKLLAGDEARLRRGAHFIGSRDEDLQAAIEYAQKVIAIDERMAPRAYQELTKAYGMMRQYDRAVASAKRIIELDPNNDNGHALYGVWLWLADRAEEGIEPLKKAFRLAPYPVVSRYSMLGSVYRHAGRYSDAIDVIEQGLARPGPKPSYLYVNLAVAQMLADREEEARATVRTLLEQRPDFTLASAGPIITNKNPDSAAEAADALRRAGLPEE